MSPNSLNNYAWVVYVVVAVAYTMLEFGVSFTDFSTPIFSARNARPPAAVAKMHLVFLLILMAFVWFDFYLHQVLWSSLPLWLTVNLVKRTTLFDLLSLLVAFLLGVVERRWIFVECRADKLKPEGSPS